MKKIISKVLFIVILLAIGCTLSLSVSAAGDPGLTGKNYVMQTLNTTTPEIYFTHVAVNNSSTTDTVTFTVERELMFGGSISGTYEVNALLYKTAVTAEVNFGITMTQSTSMAWTVAPYSSVICRYGSAMVRTTGRMETWYYGRLISSRYVVSDYSYASYSDKTEY